MRTRRYGRVRMILAIVAGLAALVFIVLYAPLRFWFRTPAHNVLDPDDDSDDPGVNVDDFEELS